MSPTPATGPVAAEVLASGPAPLPVPGRGSAMVMALAGMAMLSSMDAFAKALSTTLPIAQIVFFRFTGAALIMALFLLAVRGAWPQRRFLPHHALRGAVMCLTAFLFFYGVSRLPLVVGTALAMSGPIYIAVLSVLVLKERWTRALSMGLVLGVAGGFVIVLGGGGASGGETAPVWAWIAAFLAPLSYATGVMLLKSHSTHEGAAAMTLAQGAASALIALPFALPGFVTPQPFDWALIAGLGIAGGLGYLLIVSALRVLPASVYSLVDYTSLVWAAGLGLVFFSEVPGLPLWIGGALIILACIVGARSPASEAS